jgi:hypothetical protein
MMEHPCPLHTQMLLLLTEALSRTQVLSAAPKKGVAAEKKRSPFQYLYSPTR